jgi:hypothetical protein
MTISRNAMPKAHEVMQYTPWLVVALLLTATLPAVAGPTPPLPVVEKEGKIGECVSYDPKVGRWWTVAPTKVYAAERNRTRVIATVPAKTRLTPITGNVYTTAYGKITLKNALSAIDDDGRESTLKGGTTLAVIRYEGEGSWQAWHGGKRVYVSLSEDTEYPTAQFPAPRAEWWVKVRTKQGQVGWVLADDQTVQHGVPGCNDMPADAR